MVMADDSLTGTHPFSVERGEIVMPGDVQIARPVNPAGFIPVEEPEIDDVEDEIDEEEEVSEADRSGDEEDDGRGDHSSEARGEGEAGEGGRRRRRRRRRRGGQNGERPTDGSAPMPLDAPQPSVSGAPVTGTHVIGEDGEIIVEHEVTDKPNVEGEAGRRRRGRRGGRRNGRKDRPEGEAIAGDKDEGADVVVASERLETVIPTVEVETVTVPEAAAEAEAEAEAEVPAAPVKKPRAPRKPKVVAADKVETAAVAAPEPVKAEAVVAETVAAPLPEMITTEAVVIADPNKPKKGGWWAKAKATLGG
jgi:ribonuclease E